MYKQQNKAFPYYVQHRGCYSFSLLRACEIEAKCEFSIDQINTIFNNAVARKIITADCMRIDPDKFCRMALDMLDCKKSIFQVGEINGKGEATFWPWVNKPNEKGEFPYKNFKYVCLSFRINGPISTHFVLANKAQEVIYDPSIVDYTQNEKLGGYLHYVKE